MQNNNPNNRYEIASLIRNSLQVSNIRCDTAGRCLVYDINNATFANVYLHSGNDREMRQGRESYLSKVIPQLLVNKKDTGSISGDFNCIADRKDALNKPDQKMSPSMKRFLLNQKISC